MRTTPEGLGLIKSFEGLALRAYRCPAGVLTIGYGHTGPQAQIGRAITREEADRILWADVERIEAGLTLLLRVRVSDDEWSALVSLAFNIGAAAFKSSSVLRKLNAGDRTGAASAFDLWVKARDPKSKAKIVLPGLVKRRALEKALFLRGAQASASIPATPTPAGTMPQEVFAAKPAKEVRERLDQSRSVQGGVIAAGSTGLSLVTEALSDAQDQLTGLAPYLDTAKYVLMALALAGIFFALYARYDDWKKGKR